MINYAGISREAGVSLPTVKTYYQLLEDMFIGFRVTAFSGSPRASSVFHGALQLLFDVGVRNAAAELPLESSRHPGESRAYLRAVGGHRAVEALAVPG